jgi:hypothetical protein
MPDDASVVAADLADPPNWMLDSVAVVMQTCANVVNIVATSTPVFYSKSLIASRRLPPSRFAAAGWAQGASLLDAPESIVARAARGCLGKQEVDVYRQCWPSMYAFIADEFVRAALVARGGSMTQPAQSGFSVLFGVPSASTEIAKSPSVLTQPGGNVRNGTPEAGSSKNTPADAATPPSRALDNERE